MNYAGRMPKPIYISLFFFLLASIPAVLTAHKISFSLHGFLVYLAGILIFFGAYITIQKQRLGIVVKALFLQITFVTASSIWTIYQNIEMKIPRPNGLFSNVNIMAQMLELSLPIFIILAFSKSIKGIQKWLIYGGIIVNIFALLLTQSRGAWISAAIALGILLFCVIGWRGIFIGLITVGAIASTHYKAIATRISTLATVYDPVNIERMNVWLTAPKMIIDFPLGMGFNNFKFYYPSYMISGAKELLMHPHNLFLGIATDAGILAVISFTCFLFFLARHIIKNIRYISDTFYYMLALGSAAALSTVVLHGMVDYTIRKLPVMMLFMLEAGFCIGIIDYYKSMDNSS